MITQEMIIEMSVASLVAHGAPEQEARRCMAGEGADEVTEEVRCDTYLSMNAAASAVYPLIRNQVIEEIAEKFCDLEKAAAASGGTAPDYGAFSHAIRNLRDKTDEAHNG